ncbi:MAG TPA: YbdD/YjiX family protein [Gemmatimonadales bacterium]|nr:YbdD/YjiX family protein [Gemmatimonadales bacterium]
MRAETAGRPAAPCDARPRFSGPAWPSGRLAVLAALRRVLGMPDYAGYCAHLRARHPGQPIPTEREFFDQYLAARYGDGPTRCC